MRTLLGIVGWFISILFLLTSLAGISSGDFAISLAILGWAIIVNPLFLKWFKSIANFKSDFHLAGIVFLAFVVLPLIAVIPNALMKNSELNALSAELEENGDTIVEDIRSKVENGDWRAAKGLIDKFAPTEDASIAAIAEIYELEFEVYLQERLSKLENQIDQHIEDEEWSSAFELVKEVEELSEEDLSAIGNRISSAQNLHIEEATLRAQVARVPSNNPQEAVEAYQRLLEIDPENLDYKSELEDAEAKLEKQNAENEKTRNEFESSRESILAEIKGDIDANRFEAAQDKIEKYLITGDADLSKKRKELSDARIAYARIGSQWQYSKYNDDMADGYIYQASVKSTNTFNFDFPYSGTQRATLLLRTHPRYGKDLILRIERGQFLCSSYDGCSVLVRFDDNQAERYRAGEPSDNSSDVIFIRNYSRFAGKMLDSKTVRISANFYQEGDRVFRFDVSGFKVDKYRPPG